MTCYPFPFDAQSIGKRVIIIQIWHNLTRFLTDFSVCRDVHLQPLRVRVRRRLPRRRLRDTTSGDQRDQERYVW